MLSELILWVSMVLGLSLPLSLRVEPDPSVIATPLTSLAVLICLLGPCAPFLLLATLPTLPSLTGLALSLLCFLFNPCNKLIMISRILGR